VQRADDGLEAGQSDGDAVVRSVRAGWRQRDAELAGAIGVRGGDEGAVEVLQLDAGVWDDGTGIVFDEAGEGETVLGVERCRREGQGCGKENSGCGCANPAELAGIGSNWDSPFLGSRWFQCKRLLRGICGEDFCSNQEQNLDSTADSF
jgi:hypothetical protein